MKKYLMLFILPAFLVGCSEDKDKKTDTPKPGNIWSTIFGQPKHQQQLDKVLVVADELGQPLAGAKILIGDAINQPFANNFLVADQNGQVQIPDAWNVPMNITVQAAGYVRLTYLQQEPKALTFKLHKVRGMPTLELKGITQGHDVKNGDDIIDFGLVMQALTRQDLLIFDINKVISPQMDTISAGGRTSYIPSNVTLPKQKESYFIPITLDKPSYRLYFGEQGVHRVFAAKGRFPFEKVIDEMRNNKKFYELINYFSILGGSVRDVNVTSDKNQLDMPTADIKITQKRKLSAPQFRADEVMIAVSAADMNGYMIPTDVKKLNPGQKMDLGFLPEQKPLILSALKRQSEFETQGADRLSAVLDDFTDGVTPDFLPLIENPKMASNGDVLLPAPHSPNGVNPIATYSILSDIKQVQNGKETVEVINHTWEVYSSNWISTMHLPTWPETDVEAAPAAKKRWEVSFIGSRSKQNVELGNDIVEAATHVTHSSISF